MQAPAMVAHFQKRLSISQKGRCRSINAASMQWGLEATLKIFANQFEIPIVNSADSIW